MNRLRQGVIDFSSISILFKNTSPLLMSNDTPSRATVSSYRFDISCKERNVACEFMFLGIDPFSAYIKVKRMDTRIIV